MFLGQYSHTIDEKGRTTIPVRYREWLTDGAYITQGFDQNLIVLTASAFEQIYQRINQMSITDPNARLLRRLMFASAERVEIDRVGRFLIPQFLRDAAQLQETAMLVGAGGHFEIWSPELWKQQETLLQDAEARADRFSALNLAVG